jgi:hypothetical protein
MVQLACMDTESVLEVVKILTGTMAQIARSRSGYKVLRFGAWVWGVLGKCRDRTELGSEEIAVLRELGKRAVRLLMGTRDKTGKAPGAGQEASEREGEGARTSTLPDQIVAEIAPEDSQAGYDSSIQKEGLDPNGSTSNEQDSAALEAAKKRLKGSFLSTDDIESPSAAAANGEIDNATGINATEDKLDVDQQIRITLDMIVTIIGDFYGQRDLLEFRDIWEEV